VRYVVLKEGSGASPQPTATVTVHYTGWLYDGTKFDSSVDRGKPYTLSLSKFVPGFSQSVGMMKVGEKRRIIIPPQLGYGMQGSGAVVPPNATLIFEVELLEVK
jgi:peptidylprolyl isomerase